MPAKASPAYSSADLEVLSRALEKARKATVCFKAHPGGDAEMRHAVSRRAQAITDYFIAGETDPEVLVT
jgi:hypothetical protein